MGQSAWSALREAVQLPSSMGELVRIVHEILPDAIVAQRDDGQIVVETGLRMDDDGSLRIYRRDG